MKPSPVDAVNRAREATEAPQAPQFSLPAVLTDAPRRGFLRQSGAVGLAVLTSWTPGCGGGGGEAGGAAGGASGGAADGAAAPGGGNASTGGVAPGGTDGGGATGTAAAAPAGTWAFLQSSRNQWLWHTPAWSGGDAIALDGVQAGSTLVLCVWGYVGQGGAGFRLPVDSRGQPVRVASDAQLDARLPVQLVAWVVHDAVAGRHQFSNLPDFGSQGFGDGVAVLMEFRRDTGAPSSAVVRQATATLNDLSAPWFTAGAVTLPAGAAAGDLLITCSFEEELSQGSAQTTYTHPPAGWQGVAVQLDSTDNIAGSVSWRLAPDGQAQTVNWNWTYVDGQDPTIFKALILALR